MFLYDFFVWLGTTTVGSSLSQSTAAFASAEALHIVALSLLGGSVLITNLSTLGVVLKPVSPADVARNLQPVIFPSLVLVAVSGALLVSAGPYKYYTNPLFPLKLLTLVAALSSQWWLQRRLKQQGADGISRAVAAAGLLLWLTVVIAGRWLGLI
jgi:hypothetical protein